MFLVPFALPYVMMRSFFQLYDRIHSASVSPGRVGVTQDVVEIARDVVELMRDYEDAMIPEVHEIRDLLIQPHFKVSSSHAVSGLKVSRRLSFPFEKVVSFEDLFFL